MLWLGPARETGLARRIDGKKNNCRAVSVRPCRNGHTAFSLCTLGPLVIVGGTIRIEVGNQFYRIALVSDSVAGQATVTED